ncbi:MAG: DUF1385 domain-containing protein [Acidimicrobiales bacterium]
MQRPTRLGGQAVLDGVMIRADSQYAVAVRHADGSVRSTCAPTPAWGETLGRVPILRGAVAFAETVYLGSEAMKASRSASGTGEAGKRGASVTAATVVSLAVFVLFFAVAPAAIAGAVTHHRLVFAAVEVTARLGFFLLYVVGIGRLPGVSGAFEYHGAEHKTIAAFEAGEPLTPATVQAHSVRHARCGTDFLVMVLVVGMVVYSALGPLPWAAVVASRVLLVPVVAGVAYELLKLSARSGVGAVLARPGLALQRLTTREPTDAQVEVAIAALNAAVGANLSSGIVPAA